MSRGRRPRDVVSRCGVIWRGQASRSGDSQLCYRDSGTRVVHGVCKRSVELTTEVRVPLCEAGVRLLEFRQVQSWQTVQVGSHLPIPFYWMTSMLEAPKATDPRRKQPKHGPGLALVVLRCRAGGVRGDVLIGDRGVMAGTCDRDWRFAV